jgi:hypothetical protein
MRSMLGAFVWLLMLAVAVPVWAEEEGSTVVSTALRSEPQSSSQEVATVPADTTVIINERKGSWFQVTLKDTPDKTGWMRMFDVKMQGGSSGGKSGGKSLASVFGGLFGGKSDSGAQSTIGIRGLSEEDLKTAHPNPAELNKMEQYKSSKENARKLAEAANLKEQQVNYIEQPTR